MGRGKGSGAGRPSMLTDEILDYLPELIESGASDRRIASILGVDQSLISYWKRTNKKFLLKYHAAKERMCKEVEWAMHKRARGYKSTLDRGKMGCVEVEYPPDPNAAKLFLERHRPKEESTGPGFSLRVIDSDGRATDISISTARGTDEDIPLDEAPNPGSDLGDSGG